MSFSKIVLLSSLAALAGAQAPVSAILLDSNSYNLGAAVSWTGTAGSSFDLYGKSFQYKQDCTQVMNWNELAGNLNGFSYNYYPTPDSTGWAGYWCYGVSANGGAIVPIHWPVVMGMKWYVNLFYFNPDCSPLQGPPSYPGQFYVLVTRIQDGTMVMPQVEAPNPWRYAGYMRLKSYGIVNVQVTTPKGRVYNFTDVFHIGGVPNEDDAAPYLEVDLNPDGSESLCKAQSWTDMQKGNQNH